MDAHQIYSASRPRVGAIVTYEGRPCGVVHSVEGNLCWCSYDGGAAQPFIWCFKDGLNALHAWPSKQRDHRLAFCPGVSV